jgi:hypothetical protein
MQHAFYFVEWFNVWGIFNHIQDWAITKSPFAKEYK